MKKTNLEANYNLASLILFLENYIEASNYYKNVININVKA